MDSKKVGVSSERTDSFIHPVSHTRVWGQVIDEQTRCVHWNSIRDIIALKFKCCNKFYPCRDCHDVESDHTVQLWSKSDSAELAVLCGACGSLLSIAEYLACHSECPYCKAAFNPGCHLHRDLYFDF